MVQNHKSITGKLLPKISISGEGKTKQSEVTKIHHSPEKEYKYIEITRMVHNLPIEEADADMDGFDLEGSVDDQIDIYVKVCQLRSIREKEYLILKMMGYKFCDMQEILEVSNMGNVYWIGLEMKRNFARIVKETRGFSL